MSSTTATAADRSARAGSGRLWIDGPWRDLLLYMGTPLLILPFALAVPGRPGMEQLLLYVGGFGALGHHLPGMMRAYGDRSLFQRFRVRFVLAPLVLVPVCVYFSLNNLGGIILVTFFWTSWHTLMQIFGFARIYDAKVGSPTRWVSRLDLALCVAWIGAPLLLSDSRLGGILETWYGSGGPLLSTTGLVIAREVWMVLVAFVSLLWLSSTVRLWRRGNPPSPAKLILFASSFAFWWFCMANVANLLLGIALFDIFHDVQYLALVWTFNKARVASDPSVGRLSSFLFRGRATLIGIYVGLVVAYGSIGYLSEGLASDTLRRGLLGVLAASALLHFYFDGFIWKVREASTRKALSVEGGGDDIHLGGKLPGWAVHGLKWLGFAVPLATFYVWEKGDERPERVWREAIVAAVPNSAEALTHLGTELDLRADPQAVLELHRSAIAKKPSHPVSHSNLGTALFLLGQTEEAEAAFRRAIELFPGYSAAHRHLGTLLVATGRGEEAGVAFRSALEHDSRDGSAWAGLGRIAASAGQASEAIELYEKALRFKPRERTALNGLAWLLATHPGAELRDGVRAVEMAERLLAASQEGDPLVLDTAAAAYAEAGRFGEAVRYATDAMNAARALGRGDLAAALEEHLILYLGGRPLRVGG